MEGKIDFTESFKRRMALLRDHPADVYFNSIIENIVYTKGVMELSRELKGRGCRLVMASGGFQPIVKYIANQLNFDHYFANMAVVEDGRFTGDVHGTIVDAKRKAQILSEIANEYNVPRERVHKGNGG
jgi:phosphoserine phosphatase